MALQDRPWLSEAFAISCGTITFDLATSKVLVVRYLHTGEILLPKGRKNIAETLEKTAVRETLEETGVTTTLLPIKMPTLATKASDEPHDEETTLLASEPIAVDQRTTADGVLKIIFWFVASADSQQPFAGHEPDFEPFWLPYADVAEALSFAVDRTILFRALQAVHVTNLRPLDTEDSPFDYTFRISCNSCREVHPKLVTVSRFASNELSGSRGTANFVWKCQNCRHESSATIKAAPKPYVAGTGKGGHPARQMMLEFDCRGCEFVEFVPDGLFVCDGETGGQEEDGEVVERRKTGTVFDEVELGEGEWYDYDEKVSEEVSIKEVKWEIRNSA